MKDEGVDIDETGVWMRYELVQICRRRVRLESEAREVNYRSMGEPNWKWKLCFIPGPGYAICGGKIIFLIGDYL